MASFVLPRAFSSCIVPAGPPSLGGPGPWVSRPQAAPSLSPLPRHSTRDCSTRAAALASPEARGGGAAQPRAQALALLRVKVAKYFCRSRRTALRARPCSRPKACGSAAAARAQDVRCLPMRWRLPALGRQCRCCRRRRHRRRLLRHRMWLLRMRLLRMRCWVARRSLKRARQSSRATTSVAITSAPRRSWWHLRHSTRRQAGS